jgi:hypothetical protein
MVVAAQLSPGFVGVARLLVAKEEDQRQRVLTVVAGVASRCPVRWVIVSIKNRWVYVIDRATRPTAVVSAEAPR